MIAYIQTTDGLSFINKGRPVSISASHDKFAKMVEMLKDPATTVDDLMDTLEEDKRAIEAALRAADGQLSEALEIRDGVVRYYGEPLHIYVANKLVDMVKQGFQVKPVVNFIERLMKNPSHRAVEHLYSFLEYGKNPLTEEGKFIAYKAVRADWKDIHSGTFDNSVGAEVEMPRWKVDEDPTRTCSSGLHACSYDYLPHFAHQNGHVVLVEIDPADVVAIPADYNNTKMRVCKYKVVQEFEGYYKEHGDILSSTAMLVTGAFVVEVRNNDDEPFRAISGHDTLVEGAQAYEDTNENDPYYEVRLVNSTTGKVLDEHKDEELYESDDDNNDDNRDGDGDGYGGDNGNGGDDDDVTFEVKAFDNLESYRDDIASESADDFGTAEDAMEHARDLMENFPIVQVVDSNGNVIKTYGYIG